MTQNPRILITNDDGVDAPGLQVMLAIARTLSNDVWVVAPDGNQSGAGHRLSFGREMVLSERGHQIFAVDGSPADCVVAACTHVLADRLPDLILSGVNAGQNLGDIISCSGTVAGAREGTMQGALSIAMSQGVHYAAGHSEVNWTNAERFGAAVIRTIMANAGAGKGTYYNVNFPWCAPEEVSGIRVVPHQRFARSPFRYYPSDNAGKFFVAIPETPRPLDVDGDFHQLHNEKAITVTPLTLVQTDLDAARRLDGALTL